MSERRLNVVVVEDDAEQRELVINEIAAKGFNVKGCADATALWRHLTVSHCDLIVLDVGLPGEDGLSVAEHLRTSSQVGIVMLTGYSASADQVRGLRHGADAYLTKPVDYPVLVATLESLGRRLRGRHAPPPAAGQEQGDGDWQLVADGWKLRTPDQQDVILTAYERDMLRCLIRASGRPIDRESLIGALTRDVHDFDPHRLEMVIYRLRRKIRAVSECTLPLEAVRGVGYLVNGMSEERALAHPLDSVR
ncbi:MAG: response regulator transcription factor [Alcanivorax sp.]|uniref:response regulator transcription factor n=1 Tax=Alloalcanivorax marinus TaxID=1177169 RepID=UPI0019580734|nr:response regulator transcription factor [Alloalcanivorax marinus]MBM7332942.1 response regulator transcription factor [Alloalcanivorax marinus]MCU5788218.1 two-component response regulator [Alloalcanivorax marinus]